MADMGDQSEFPKGQSLEKFRQAVINEFGKNLEKATPSNVRQFLARLQASHTTETLRGRVVLNETKTTYEEILKDFFVRVLEKPSDESVIILWTVAFELSFFLIEQHASDHLSNLFKEPSEGNSPEFS